MRNKLYLPRIPYVVFELVKIDIEKSKEEGYKAEQIDTIYLAVTPEDYNCDTQGRNAVTQTTNKIFVDRHENRYKRITISGTFGDTPRLIGGTFMDGWNRLKQFEDRVIKMKLETYYDKEKAIQDDIDKNKVILAVNCYDFLFQEFGVINLENFNIRSNARQNSKLIQYRFTYDIIGDLISTKETFSEGDPLLYSLNTVLGPDAQKFIDDSVNYALYYASSVTKWLGMLDVIDAATYLVKSVIDMANNYVTGAQQEINRRSDQITQFF